MYDPSRMSASDSECSESDDEAQLQGRRPYDDASVILPSFYYMENRRIDRLLTKRVKGAGKTTTLFTIFLVSVLINYVFSTLSDDIVEPQKIIDGYTCPGSSFRLDRHKHAKDCLREAIYSSDCTDHGTPWIQFEASSGCFCCKTVSKDEPTVGAPDSRYTLYRMRRAYHPNTRWRRILVPIVAGVLTFVFGLAWFFISALGADSPWSSWYFITTIIFIIWMLASRLISEKRNCFFSGYLDLCVLQGQMITFWVFVGVWTLSAVLYFLVVPYRKAVLRNMCDRQVGAFSWWRLRREPDVEKGRPTYSYKPNGWFGWERRTFFWKGEANAQGLPHGSCKWSDDGFYGEVLKGIWEDGEPKGVWRSRQYGSGAIMEQFPVGYASARADCTPGDLGNCSNPPERAETITYGMCMVEVSVAGGFFPFLPRINFETAFPNMVDLATALKTTSRPLLHVMQKSQSGTHEQEAVLFVHGWNTPLDNPIHKIAQVLCMGKGKPHLYPFVFGWAPGAGLSIAYVKASSLDYVPDFITVLRDLEKRFHSVHVICHSAGVHLWCAVFPHIKHLFSKCQRVTGVAAQQGDGLLDLKNIILMNGDVLVEVFAEVVPEMLNYTDRLTTYNDKTDVAIAANTWLQRIMPRSWQAGWRDPDLDSITETYGHTVEPVWLQPGPNGGTILGGPVIDACLPGRVERKACPPDGDDSLIDIVDCSNNEFNAAFSRHCYFAVNTLMVEDLCELMGTCKPASKRTHLIKRYGNVFDFLAAPAAMAQ